MKIALFAINVTWPYNTEKPAIWFAPKTQRKRYKNQANGRFFRVYLVQSVHALHSERVNAARASVLAR